MASSARYVHIHDVFECVNNISPQAFKHLLDLHVLFALPESHEGVALPTASVSLSFDDEAQYRCAGYIQAEIERYAESLGSEAADDEEEGEKDTDRGESSDGEPAEDGKAVKHGKGKKVPKEGSSNFNLISVNLMIVAVCQSTPLLGPVWKKNTCLWMSCRRFFALFVLERSISAMALFCLHTMDAWVLPLIYAPK
jgi:hypothetical protein